jgi:hypothetical protein
MMLNHNTRKKNAKKVKKAWQNLANAREASLNAKKLLDNDAGNSDRQKAHAKQRRNFNSVFEKFMKTTIELGIDEEFFTMHEVQQITAYVNDYKHMVGHNYDEGDNSNRENGFVHNPYHTLKGKFFQHTIKPMIRKAIYGAHAYWLAKYSEDAFVYDDARLKAVDEFTKKFIDAHMAESDGAAYKIEFMHNLRDIVCGMVKEDPFYTSPFWMFINEFVKEFPDGFEMTEAEIYNWEAHHHGRISTDD